MHIGFSSIRPQMNVKPQISYKARSVEGPEPQKETKAPIKFPKTFDAGFIAGALAASMIAGGGRVVDGYDSELFMEEIRAEYNNGKYDTSLQIEDVTEDDCPDIIITDKDSSSVVYDVKHKTIIYKDKDGTEDFKVDY